MKIRNGKLINFPAPERLNAVIRARFDDDMAEVDRRVDHWRRKKQNRFLWMALTFFGFALLVAILSGRLR